MSDIALEALKPKRAERTGEIARCHATLAKLSEDLEHLDRTLRLFAPDFVAESVLCRVFTPPKSWSKRGVESAPGILNIMTRRVGQAVGEEREVGLVRSVEQTGLWLRWEIVR